MTGIMITAFEPFGGDEINASLEAVKLIGDIPGIELRKVILPVVFGKGGDLAVKVANEFSPDAVILTGQASGRKEISVEYAALNLRHARIADNEGNVPVFEKISENGENALLTSLPFKEILSGLEREGIPAKISFTAGTFVCNDTFYMMMEHFKEKGVPAGFIHLPDIKDMDSETAAKGLETIIKTITEEMK